MLRFLYFILLTVLATSVLANYEANVSYQGWVSRDGKPIPNTDNMKSIKGFGAWLVVTPDKDWVQKWETPSHVVPYFSEANTVEYGQFLTILTFYVNPLVDEAGHVDIRCDIKITRPDATVSIDDKGIECIKGKFPGNPQSVYLSPVVVEYSGDAGDLPGEWVVEVTLTDQNRNVSVPLKSSFRLIDELTVNE